MVGWSGAGKGGVRVNWVQPGVCVFVCIRGAKRKVEACTFENPAPYCLEER